MKEGMYHYIDNNNKKNGWLCRLANLISNALNQGKGGLELRDDDG